MSALLTSFVRWLLETNFPVPSQAAIDSAIDKGARER